MSRGSISAATGRLESTPISPYSAITLGKVQAKLPMRADPALLDTVDCRPLLVDSDLLLDVLAQMNPNAAGGPSGMTAPHVNSACKHSAQAREETGKFMTTMLAGKLPHLPELTDSRLVPFEKGCSVRPINVDEIIFRVAGLCALALRPTAGVKLTPHQLGMGVKGGSQAVGHAVRAAVEEDPDVVVVTSDFEKAFGSIKRESMFAAVKKREPAWPLFVQWSHARSNRCWFDDAPADAPPLRARSLQRNQPMGPALFAMPVQDALELMADLHSDAPLLAYLDDGYTLGSADAVIATAPHFLAACAPLGLKDVLRKGEVFSRNAAAAVRVAEILGFKDCSATGIMVIGTPMGTHEWVQQQCMDKAKQACALVDTLIDLPELPKQHKLLMLRCSIQQKLRHLPRTAEPRLVSGAIALLERRVRAATLHIVDITEQRLPEGAALQLGLPLCHGELGILEMTPEEALAALLSSAAQAQAPLKTAARLLQVFEGVRGEQLRVAARPVVDTCARDGRCARQQGRLQSSGRLPMD